MKYLIAIRLFFQTTIMSAQYQKGTWALGGSGQGGLSATRGNIESLNLTLSPKIGYIPVKNLEFTSTTHFGIWGYRLNEKLESGFNTYSDLSVRYHFNFGRLKENDGYSWKPFSIYPIIGAGTTSNLVTSTSKPYILLSGVGFSWFINKTISVDSEFIYEWSPNSTQRDIRTSIGLTYYLGR